MAGEMIPGMSGMSGLMSLLQKQMETQAEQEPRRREEVDRRAAQVDSAYGARPDPNTESSARLFAAAQGFGRPGNFWGALAEAGNRYITLRAQQEEAARKLAVEEALKEYEISRNAYKDFGGGAMGSAGAMSQYLHAALDPIKNIGGVGVNRLTGSVVVPKGYEQIHSQVYKKFFDQFTAAKDPQAAEKAKQMADWYVLKMSRNPSVASGPVQEGGGLALPNREGAAPPAEAASALPAGEGVETIPGTAVQAGADMGRVEQTLAELAAAEREAVTRGDYSLAAEIQAARKEFKKAKGQAQAGSPPQIPYKDARDEELRKKQGELAGKNLEEEMKMIQSGAAAATSSLAELKLLENIYSDTTLPEGELAPYIQKIQSSLKSLGVDVGDQASQADLARAVASKMAMKLRTAGGENLLPGQMSNYEDKLLQQMVPVLSLTREGRVALNEYMQSMMQSTRRMAEEANKYAKAHDGFLDQNWYQRKERIMREELARLSVEMNQTMRRFRKEKQ